jgi:hypothetical protein
MTDRQSIMCAQRGYKEPCETLQKGHFCSFCGLDMAPLLAARKKWGLADNNMIITQVLALAAEAIHACDGREVPYRDETEHAGLYALIDEANERFFNHSAAKPATPPGKIPFASPLITRHKLSNKE